MSWLFAYVPATSEGLTVLSLPIGPKPRPHGWCCDCTDSALGWHCEGHFEEHLRACLPCPRGTLADGHALADDFDGTRYCVACIDAAWTDEVAFTGDWLDHCDEAASEAAAEVETLS